MRPIFWGVWIIKSELVKSSCFHLKTSGKLNSDYIIRKSHKHFRKKDKAREMDRVEKIVGKY